MNYTFIDVNDNIISYSKMDFRGNVISQGVWGLDQIDYLFRKRFNDSLIIGYDLNFLLSRLNGFNFYYLDVKESFEDIENTGSLDDLILKIKGYCNGNFNNVIYSKNKPLRFLVKKVS